MINEGTAPWFVTVYMVKEYAAAKNLIIISRSMFALDDERIAVSNIISLIRLIDGGAAMFHAANKNHHIEIVGEIINKPFVKYILRV